MEKYNIYVDESIHDASGFIMTAAIITPDDLSNGIKRCLVQAGLRPGLEEYKSSGLKEGRKDLQRLRSCLMSIISRSGVRIALAITPANDRPAAGPDMLGLISSLKVDGLLGESPKIWFDEGLLSIDDLNGARACGLDVRPENDSKKVLELQLADLVAHSAAMILKSELGHLSKSYPVGPGSGYDPDTQITLDFELWAGLRSNLAGPTSPPHDPNCSLGLATLFAFGLYVSPKCLIEVVEAAKRRFQTVYLGCIH